MRGLFAEARRLLEAGEPFALATVVSTSGSTPQKPGARLLVRADGSIEGTVGGGCVEAEVWDRAMTALRQGGGRSLGDFVLSDDLAAETGMVCGGTLTVFIETLTDAASNIPMVQAIERALAGGEPACLATVVSSPREDRVGAKLLLEGGGTSGSLGDSSWNEAALTRARHLRAKGGSTLMELAEAGRVFVEAFLAPPTLLMVGAGHIAQALCPMAKRVGLRVVVIDDRGDFANEERFPEADEVLVSDFASAIHHYPTGASTSIVIATRGHKQDDLALREAIRSNAGYVGLVGSRRKVVLIYRQLLEEGVPRERLRSIHAPIGLDIGGHTPEEIALSILAEVVMERYGGTGRPLRLDERLLPQPKEAAAPRA